MSKTKDWQIESEEKLDEEAWALLEAEWEWLNRHPHSYFFHEFNNELACAKRLLITGISWELDETLNKLVYAHTVTLMETFISSAVGKLIVEDKGLLLNLVDEYKVLSGMKVTLKEVLQQPKIVEKRVIATLGDQSFHNVSTISQVLNAMFGEHMRGLDMSEIARICEVRHHIVHRNGKTWDDQPIELSRQEVQKVMQTISDFVENVNERIYTALTERESAGF